MSKRKNLSLEEEFQALLEGKNLSLEEVFQALLEGKKIRDEDWGDDQFIRLVDGVLMDEVGDDLDLCIDNDGAYQIYDPSESKRKKQLELRRQIATLKQQVNDLMEEE